MYRVKRPNRLNRKWAAGTGQHLVRDGDDGAATLEGLQGSKSGTFVGGRDAARHASAYERARGLGKRQRRRDALTGDSQLVQCGGVSLEQRG